MVDHEKTWLTVKNPGDHGQPWSSFRLGGEHVRHVTLLL